MPRFLFLFFVLANAFLDLAVVGGLSEPNAAFGAAPASISLDANGAEPPSGRKLGKHRSKVIVASTTFSPSEAPRGEEKLQASSSELNGGESEIHLDNQKHRHASRDKSIAGGGVILGGLATAFLVSVICYIRATRRQK